MPMLNLSSKLNHLALVSIFTLDGRPMVFLRLVKPQFHLSCRCNVQLWEDSGLLDGQLESLIGIFNRSRTNEGRSRRPPITPWS